MLLKICYVHEMNVPLIIIRAKFVIQSIQIGQYLTSIP